jgi:iron(III) transport system substrate-binding protein
MSFIIPFFIFALALPLYAQSDKPVELVLYSSRNSDLLQPVLKAYQKETGVVVRHIEGSAGSLVQKLVREGDKSPADLLITVDVGHLIHGAQSGLLEPLAANEMTQRVPVHLRDDQWQWLGLSLRARTIFYNKKKVKPQELVSYQDLAHPKWKGRLCLRTSRKVYNQSLVAGLIGRLGQAETEKVVKGWVSNLARPVFTSDTHLLEAIDKGRCDVGIANTYYLARLQKKGEAQNVGIFWPTQDNGGTHVNISGVGILKTSKNKQQALRFVNWLVSDSAQKVFAEANDEYPVVPLVPLSKLIQSWGPYHMDTTPLSQIGEHQKQAVQLMDRARYR